MYIPIKSEPRLSGLGWFIDATIGTTRTSAGHEKLTELADQINTQANANRDEGQAEASSQGKKKARRVA